MGRRDVRKRLKGFGIPIEVCVKYERLAGLKTGETPNKSQADKIAAMMVTSITLGVQHVKLEAEDYKLIAEEVKSNEQK